MVGVMVQVYVVVGVFIAFAFLVRGLNKATPGVTKASISFTGWVFPSLVLLWPLTVVAWVRSMRTPKSELP